MHDKVESNGSAPEKKQHKVSRKTKVGCSVLSVLAIGFVLWNMSRSVSSVSSGPRHEASNHAKNIALAQKNHASQMEGRFSAPTHLNSKGEPVFGWFTRLLPLLDHAALYDKIAFEKSYTDPANAKIFKTVIRVALIPEFKRTTDAHGYGLIHFTLNERLFPGNISLAEDIISRADGLGNTILMGEIQEALPAWGAPGNARDPALGLKSGPDTMGVSVHAGSTYIGFADGRVVPISNKINPAILRAISTPDGGEPVADGDY